MSAPELRHALGRRRTGDRGHPGLIRGAVVAGASLCIAQEASAHPADALLPHELWTAWSSDPLVLVPLGLSAALYATGISRVRRSSGGERGVPLWQVGFFAAGWLVLFIALVSPLDAIGGVLFSGHMLQHELLMIVAAPLLVISRPLVPMLWGLPVSWRRRAGSWSQRPAIRTGWHAVTDPLVAWLLHAVALWTWHIPVLFEATLVSDTVHALQHASFFVTALLFWWAVVHGRAGRLAYGLAVLYVFTTAVHNSLLGALLTFASTVWYPIYEATTLAWGLTPLEDQQLGGLIMWVPGGVLYLIAGLALFAAWLREAERLVERHSA